MTDDTAPATDTGEDAPADAVPVEHDETLPADDEVVEPEKED